MPQLTCCLLLLLCGGAALAAGQDTQNTTTAAAAPTPERSTFDQVAATREGHDGFAAQLRGQQPAAQPQSDYGAGHDTHRKKSPKADEGPSYEDEKDEYFAGNRHKRTFEHNDYDKYERRWSRDAERSSPYSSRGNEEDAGEGHRIHYYEPELHEPHHHQQQQHSARSSFSWLDEETDEDSGRSPWETKDRPKALPVKHREQQRHHTEAEPEGEDAAGLFIRHRIAREAEPEDDYLQRFAHERRHHDQHQHHHVEERHEEEEEWPSYKRNPPPPRRSYEEGPEEHDEAEEYAAPRRPQGYHHQFFVPGGGSHASRPPRPYYAPARIEHQAPEARVERRAAQAAPRSWVGDRVMFMYSEAAPVSAQLAAPQRRRLLAADAGDDEAVHEADSYHRRRLLAAREEEEEAREMHHRRLLAARQEKEAEHHRRRLLAAREEEEEEQEAREMHHRRCLLAAQEEEEEHHRRRLLAAREEEEAREMHHHRVHRAVQHERGQFRQLQRGERPEDDSPRQPDTLQWRRR